MWSRVRASVRALMRPPASPVVVPPPPVPPPVSPPVPTRVAFHTAQAELGPAALTVLDVGARWGANDSWFRMKPLARLIGFEPDPEEW